MPHSTTATHTSAILTRYPSATRPGVKYTVKVAHDHTLYCDCPAWRFQKVSPHLRQCDHTRRANQSLIDRYLTRVLIPRQSR